MEDEAGRPGDYWGNWFRPEPDQVPEREAWTCVEWRVKANAAVKAKGELDCWVGEKKCGALRAMDWRSALADPSWTL